MSHNRFGLHMHDGAEAAIEDCVVEGNYLVRCLLILI